MSTDEVRYIQRHEIDILKWDDCIERAANGLVYGYSFYLDQMSAHWGALVMGDYKSVMPLTWNRKYGIHYLYQPAFTASLGIFGTNLNEQIIQQFIEAIPQKFRLAEISLNFGNQFSAQDPRVIVRNNYVLRLDKSYEELYQGFRDNIKRNVKKCVQLGVRYESGIPVSSVVELSKSQMQKISNLSDSDYHRFEKLFGILQKKGQARTYGVYLSQQLVASAVYFFSHERAYYILVGNHPNGKTAGASHYLIDRFIHAHAGQNLLLDFEGSDIGNLAFFYSSFGATLETYPALRINRLPWWAKMFKKSH